MNLSIKYGHSFISWALDTYNLNIKSKKNLKICNSIKEYFGYSVDQSQSLSQPSFLTNLE